MFTVMYYSQIAWKIVQTESMEHSNNRYFGDITANCRRRMQILYVDQNHRVVF